MRLICHLREFRGERTLAVVAAESGVSQADLSRIERGVMLSTDSQIPALERAYGKPIAEWYPPQVLLALSGDDA